LEILNHAATVVANAKVEQLLEKVDEHKEEIKKEAGDKQVPVQKHREVVLPDPKP
jgi:outer membrane lipoprotein SlyB